ncbi:MAG: aryl-sulfate sulfotransferase [Planctomycetia bacterium]|nr:aryl-sulfate sulfotransferase [Planctomycetia bacterium]
MKRPTSKPAFFLVALTSTVLYLHTNLRAAHASEAPDGPADAASAQTDDKEQPADAKPEATDAQPEQKAAEAPKPAVKFGLNLHDPRALLGYTLLSPLGGTKTFLLDMEGRVVRTWDCGCQPMSSYILKNGNMLRFGKLAPEEQKFGNGPGEAGRIQEFTFDGEVVWDYKLVSENQLPHHDIYKLPNGNVLMVVWEKKSRDDAIAAGRAPENLDDKPLQPDCIMEVKPTGKESGEIVWEWHLWDHLIQDRDPSKANYGNVAEHPELVDVNFGEGLAQALKDNDTVNQLAGIGYVGAPAAGQAPKVNADWTHFNGIDYNAELDQIVISVHAFSEIWIIDHSTTTDEAKGHTGGRSGKGGDLLYRWGNPIAYRAGTKENQTSFKQHNAQWIPKGHPGEGHLLLFNNQHEVEGEKFSTVDELVTPVDEKGNYQRPTGEAFGPKEPVWSYAAPKRTDFYSSFISGTHRLPNGNTMICSGANGTLFEVTPEKEIVWKFINPTKENPFGGGPGGGPGGMFGPPEIGKLLPSFAIDRLKLTDEQKEKLAAIENDAQTKLDELLTEDQRKEFAELKKNPFPFPGGPGGGPGGPGGPNFGPPGGGPRVAGGPGGPGGPNFGPPAGGPNFGPPGGGRGPDGGGPGDAAGPGDGRGRGDRRGGGGGPPGGDSPPGGTAVFRAYRYAADYVGFQGKDLTPGKTLVEIVDEAEKAKEQAKDKEAEKKDGQDDAKQS